MNTPSNYADSSRKYLDLYFGRNSLGDITTDTFGGWKDDLHRNIRTLKLQYNGIKSIQDSSLDNHQENGH